MANLTYGWTIRPVGHLVLMPWVALRRRSRVSIWRAARSCSSAASGASGSPDGIRPLTRYSRGRRYAHPTTQVKGIEAHQNFGPECAKSANCDLFLCILCRCSRVIDRSFIVSLCCDSPEIQNV